MVETAIVMILLYLTIVVACAIVIIDDYLYQSKEEYKPSERLAKRWEEQLCAGMTAAMLTPLYVLMYGPKSAPHVIRFRGLQDEPKRDSTCG
jgi:hypothetical protein